MKKISLVLLLSFSFFDLSYADTREPLLEVIKGTLRLNLSDGIIYEGQFEDCLINGKQITCINTKGIYTFQTETGYLYKGEFKDNKPNGQGVFTSPDGQLYQEGSRYEGEWKNDKRDGQGVMIYLDDGRRLEGEFKENVFIGN